MMSQISKVPIKVSQKVAITAPFLVAKATLFMISWCSFSWCNIIISFPNLAGTHPINELTGAESH